MTTYTCPKCHHHWVMGPTRDMATLECAFCLRKSYNHLLSERDTLLREAEEISEAIGESYSGASPTDPGPDPHHFDLHNIKKMREDNRNLRITLAGLKALLDYADSDGRGLKGDNMKEYLYTWYPRIINLLRGFCEHCGERRGIMGCANPNCTPVDIKD